MPSFRQSVLLAAFAALSASSQTGLHIQQFDVSPAFFLSKDSAFCFAGAAPVNRVAVVNPETREWHYQNDSDFKSGTYPGIIHMRSATDGVAFYTPGAKDYVTKDGWKTIDSIVSGPGNFVATDEGYVSAGSTAITFSAEGRAWTKTSDGLGMGTTWLASNGKDVFILKDNFFVTSKDGGKTVVNNFTTINTDSITGNTRVGLKMFDSTLVMATNEGLFYAVDPTKPWAKKALPENETLSRILWKSKDEILILTQSGKAFFSDNGGGAWSPKPNFEFRATLVYYGGILYDWPRAMSKDNGNTWINMFPQSTAFSGLTFGFAFQGAFGVAGHVKGILSYTFDKGRSFPKEDTIPGSEDVFALKITKAGGLYAGDRNSNIFYSADTGKTWAKRNANAFSTNAVKFSLSADEKTVVLTRAGQPLVSTDGGKTFSSPVSVGGNHSEAVLPSGRIFTAWELVGAVEIAEITSDGQRVAKDSVVANGDSPADLVAVDEKLGFLVNANSGAKETRIYRTTDGFASFKLLSAIKDEVYAAGRLQVLSGGDTLVISQDGKAYCHRSFDGGKTWSKYVPGIYPQYASKYPSLKRVYFFDGRQMIASLNDAGIWLDITSPDAPSSVRPFAARRSGARSQARFDARSGSILLEGMGKARVEVEIFDHLGRRVLAVSDHDASARVEAAGLSRGVYFLRARGAGVSADARFVRD